jgi:Fe-S cluster assembly ATP-binding protein
MATLEISDLTANVGGRQILHGVNLTVRSGEVHAVMGPNGAGKSTLAAVLMGRAGYEVTGGSMRLDGVEMLGLATWERAAAGLHLVMQYPTEVPGVALDDAMAAALTARHMAADDLEARLASEADRIGLQRELLHRPLNVDLSGGERKRNETLQLALLRPKFAVLDELDSGLDVDALRSCARRVADAVSETGLGVVAITHYRRLLDELRPDVVHVLVRGRLVASGGPELVDVLERDGYAAFGADEAAEAASASAAARAADDPFADPFA